MDDFLSIYQKRVAAGDVKSDPAQEQAIHALNALFIALKQPRVPWTYFFDRKTPPIKRGGVYLYGGVGRGKSMLMDLFYQGIADAFPSRRVHFHAFMIETHDWLHAKRSGDAVDNLLPAYAKYLSKSIKILCFDEFHVTDVADAMILSRLFTALFKAGVTIIATSNWPPERLYEGGLQRVRFLPFIDLVKERMSVLHLESPIDYRAAAIQDLETYLFPLTAVTQSKINHLYETLSAGQVEQEQNITVKGRSFPIRAAGSVARVNFSQLCEQPHSAEDYLALVERFEIIILEHVPKMGYDRKNEVKRLMTLVDVVYDRRRRLILSAEASLDKIYYGPDYAFEFKRTISRLREMQSSSYHAGA